MLIIVFPNGEKRNDMKSLVTMYLFGMCGLLLAQKPDGVRSGKSNVLGALVQSQRSAKDSGPSREAEKYNSGFRSHPE